MLALNPKKAPGVKAVWKPSDPEQDIYISGLGSHTFAAWKRKAKTWKSSNTLSVTLQVTLFDTAGQRLDLSKDFDAGDLKGAKDYARAHVEAGLGSAVIYGYVDVRYQGSGTVDIGWFEPEQPQGFYLWRVTRAGVPVARRGPWADRDEAAKIGRDGALGSGYDEVLTFGNDPSKPGFEIVRRYRAGSGEVYTTSSASQNLYLDHYRENARRAKPHAAAVTSLSLTEELDARLLATGVVAATGWPSETWVVHEKGSPYASVQQVKIYRDKGQWFFDGSAVIRSRERDTGKLVADLRNQHTPNATVRAEYYIRASGEPESEESGPEDLESLIEANWAALEDSPDIVRRLRNMKPGAEIEFGHRAGEHSVIRRGGPRESAPYGYAIVGEDNVIRDMSRSRESLERKAYTSERVVPLHEEYEKGDTFKPNSGTRGRSQEIREGSRWRSRSTGYLYTVSGVSDQAVQVTPIGKNHIDADEASLYSFENFIKDFVPSATVREYAANRSGLANCNDPELFPARHGVRFLADQDRNAVVLEHRGEQVYLINPFEYEDTPYPEDFLWVVWVKGSRTVRVAWWGQKDTPQVEAVESVSDWLDRTCFPGLAKTDDTQAWGVDVEPKRVSTSWQPIVDAAAWVSTELQKTQGGTMARNARGKMRKNYSPHGFALVRDDGRILEIGRSRDYLETKWTTDRDLVELAAPHKVGDVITYDHRGMEVPQPRGTMSANTARRYSRLEDNPQLFPEKYGVRIYAVTEGGGGIGAPAEPDKANERVVLVDQDAREYILINPLEYDKDATVHVFHFGAYGDLHLIYLYAGRREGLEAGLEECGSWLAENAPGHIMEQGSEEYMDLFNEAKQELIDEGADPDDEEFDGKVEEKAMEDQTYTESGWIASHEWGVDTLDKDDDVAKAALYVSKKLYAAHYDEEDDEDELESNGTEDLSRQPFRGSDKVVIEKRKPNGSLDFSAPQPPKAEAKFDDVYEWYFRAHPSVKSAGWSDLKSWLDSKGWKLRAKTW